MKDRKLELYEIAGYLDNDLHLYNPVTGIVGQYQHPYLVIANDIVKNNRITLIPVLYPIDALYKTITHNSKEIVPIVEIGRMVDNINADLWKLGEYAGKPCAKKRTSYLIFDKLGRFQYSGYNVNSIKLFDYLQELKIDYRGLIDAGLAIDANTLEVNPYK